MPFSLWLNPGAPSELPPVLLGAAPGKECSLQGPAKVSILCALSALHLHPLLQAHVGSLGIKGALAL